MENDISFVRWGSRLLPSSSFNHFSTLFIPLHLPMSLQQFLIDIVTEIADRIVDSAHEAHYLTEQIVQNKLHPTLPPTCLSPSVHTSIHSTHSSQVGRDEHETFFGDEPRLMKPLLASMGRRHEMLHSKSSSDTSLFQVKVIRQKMNGACGYYSIYHSSMTIVARQCKREEEAARVLRLVFNRAFFFVIMARWKALLLKETRKRLKKLGWTEETGGIPMKDSSSGHLCIKPPELPWTLPNVRTGVLERGFMDYILNHDPLVLSIKRWTLASYHSLPEVSLSVMKSRLSIQCLESFEAISSEVKRDDRPHAFIIGQLNHWIAIVSNRVITPSQDKEHEDVEGNVEERDAMDIDSAPSSRTRSGSRRRITTSTTTVSASSKPQRVKSSHKKSRKVAMEVDDFDSNNQPSNYPHSAGRCQKTMETILLDSRNDFVLNMPDEAIPARVAHRMREFPHNGSMWHDLLVRLYENSLRDTQFSCVLFHDLAVRAVNPRVSCVGSGGGGVGPDGIGGSSSLCGPPIGQITTTVPGSPSLDPSEASESQSITTDLILLSVKGFFESYTKHVGDFFEVNGSSIGSHHSSIGPDGKEQKPRGEVDIEKWLNDFVMWIQEYSPLRVIESSVCASLKNVKRAGYVVPKCAGEAFTEWMGLLKRRIEAVHAAKLTDPDSLHILRDLTKNTFPVIQNTVKYLKRA